MANSSNMKPTTAFTRAFAAALREVMTARGVTQMKVAESISRDQTFVSERTSGKRPCDTDIIAGVAQVAGVEPKTIVREVLARMKGDDTATVTQIRPAPKAPAPTKRAARKQPKPRPGE